jgi:hypothetical protein
MAYADFTLPDALTAFSLQLQEDADLFADVPASPVGEILRATLADSLALAMNTNTEKARSELIIAPVLLELRRLRNREITFLSGIEFNVDDAAGLRGTCDFLITRSPEKFFVRAPVVAVVEARNESIKGGLGQCVAEMVAAHRFNIAEKSGIETVYGVVTTGSTWRFLKCAPPQVWIDRVEYHISSVDKVLGILVHMTR